MVVNLLLFKASPSFEHLAATTIDGTADRVAAVVVKVLAEGKFIGLFSLLFGFGVDTQVAAWQARGLPWRRLYARRMGALAVIGAAHIFLVWYGDILTTYAVMSVGPGGVRQPHAPHPAALGAGHPGHPGRRRGGRAHPARGAWTDRVKRAGRQ